MQFLYCRVLAWHQFLINKFWDYFELNSRFKTVVLVSKVTRFFKKWPFSCDQRNKLLQTGWLKMTNYFSHSSEGQQSGIRVTVGHTLSGEYNGKSTSYSYSFGRLPATLGLSPSVWLYREPTWMTSLASHLNPASFFRSHICRLLGSQGLMF